MAWGFLVPRGSQWAGGVGKVCQVCVPCGVMEGNPAFLGVGRHGVCLANGLLCVLGRVVRLLWAFTASSGSNESAGAGAMGGGSGFGKRAARDPRGMVGTAGLSGLSRRDAGLQQAEASGRWAVG